MINSISKKQLKQVKESTNNLTANKSTIEAKKSINESINNKNLTANKSTIEAKKSINESTKPNAKLSIYQQLSAINSPNANTTIKESSDSSRFNIYKELSKINSALNNMVLESNSNSADNEIITDTVYNDNDVPNTINDILDSSKNDITDNTNNNNYVVDNLTTDDLVDFYNALINGGLSKIENTTERNVDIKELRKGISIEMEHVDKNSKFAKLIATKIALDHLAELPDYYSRLETIEN